MSDIYQALNRAKETKPVTEGKRMPKDEYAKMKQEQRRSLFEMANVQSKAVVGNEKSYLQFLDLQARLDYTVTNSLLVFAQNPQATMLKDFNKWKESKNKIKPNEKGIRILEPKGDYTRADGSVGVNYDVKSVFDISQVETKLTYETPSVAQRNIISGLVYDSPVKIQELSSFENGEPVMYSPDAKTIFYASRLDSNILIQGLAREYCYAEYDSQYKSIDRNADKLLIESSAYLLCKKFGIEMKDTSFASGVKEYFDGMDAKDIKEELSNIKNLCDDVSKRMERGIYKAEQEHHNERHENAR